MQWVPRNSSTCKMILLVVAPGSAQQQTHRVPCLLRQTLLLISRINFKPTLITDNMRYFPTPKQESESPDKSQQCQLGNTLGNSSETQIYLRHGLLQPAPPLLTGRSSLPHRRENRVQGEQNTGWKSTLPVRQKSALCAPFNTSLKFAFAV